MTPDRKTASKDTIRDVEAAVVGMYTRHPSPSRKDKVSFASKRMELRLHCCGVAPEDYRGKAVLDAGCGTGEYSCWFASHGAQVTGIDLSDGSLAEARAYAKENNLTNVVFEKRSILKTGFPDAHFDLIYCTGVLHHTGDPYGGLAELVRLVRPGGLVLISMYNSAGFVPREARRRIAKFLGGQDLDRRVTWGQWLFPFTARRLTRGERNDSRSALYDYFAIPHETLHSVGEMLAWFDRLRLTYTGCFPPGTLSDYPRMFAHRSYAKVDNAYRSDFLQHFAGRVLSGPMRRARPRRISRMPVQALWLATGISMFSICGRKAGEGERASPSDAAEDNGAEKNGGRGWD